MCLRIVCIFLVLTFMSLSSVSAEIPAMDSSRAVDTLLFNGAGMLDHASPVTNGTDFEKRLYQRPTTALFKSMFVPGWGQFRNRRYIKAVIFAGLDAWFIASAIKYARQASDFREQFEASTDVETRLEYYDLYLNRKDQRNKFTWFAGIVTFVAMFDAYVDAHLSGYPRKTDEGGLSLDFAPTSEGGFLASVAFSF